MTSRAIVLSGGGPVGIGWHLGMVASLVQAGVDLEAADLIVGTSAGAVVGAQLAQGVRSDTVIERFRASLVSGTDPVDVSATVGDRMMGLLQVLAESAELPQDERLRIVGRFALDADTVPEEQFVERFAYLGTGWPRRFVCTTVDAETGAFRTWDEASEVDIVRAVASSCAVPGFFPSVTIDGRRYFDGGIRSITNFDLAAGHERVLVLTLVMLPADSPDPRAQRFRKRFDSELEAVRAAGGEAHVVSPEATVGANLMDPSGAEQALEAGLTQGKAEADRIASFWG